MKKYLIISLLVLTLSVTMVAAATTDFTSDGNITVSSALGGSESYDLLILSGSSAESWTYEASGWLKVTNPDSSATFKVGSSIATVLSIRVDNSRGTQITCADNTTAGTSYVTLPTAGDTYTVYPSVYACPTIAIGGGGSAGGGGKDKKAKEVKVLPTTPATPSPAAPALVNASPNAAFNRALSVGSTGEDVRNLQKFLNGRGFAVALTGVGSVGKETTTFGAATRAAVVKFQMDKGLIKSPADIGAGLVGPKTRAKIAEINASVVIPATTTAPAIAPAVTPAITPTANSQLNQLIELLRKLQSR